MPVVIISSASVTMHTLFEGGGIIGVCWKDASREIMGSLRRGIKGAEGSGADGGSFVYTGY